MVREEALSDWKTGVAKASDNCHERKGRFATVNDSCAYV
jgi:hypothetical protein